MNRESRTLRALVLTLAVALEPAFFGSPAFAQVGDEEPAGAGEAVAGDEEPSLQEDAPADPYEEGPLDEETGGESLETAAEADDADAAEEPADDDWDLPDDLDEDDVGDFDFGSVEEDDGLVLPLFGPTTFSLTSTTTIQYRFDNGNLNLRDDDFLSIWEKLELAMQGEGLRVNARVDGFAPFFDHVCEADDDSCFLQNDLRLERFGIHWEHDDLVVDAVDSYAVLGRGLALSLRRVDLLGVDNTLRGGQVAYDNGDVFIRALGGAVNPQNLDPQSLRIIEQPRDQLRRDLFTNPRLHDFLVGGEAGYRLSGVALGVHGLHVWLGDDDLGNRRDIDVFGWRVDAPALLGGNLSFYGEVNGQRRLTTRPDGEERVEDGHAIYGTLQGRLGNLALLAEWKDYSNYRVAATNTEGNAWRVYSAAPTLERDAERLEGGAIYNARGGRIQADYGFLPGAWSLNVNALAYGYAELRVPTEGPRVNVDPFDGTLVTHGYAKVQRVPTGEGRIDWSFAFEAGARRETFLRANEALLADPGDAQLRVIHATIEAGIVLGQHSLELLIDHRDERKLRFEYVDYIRGSASLTYSFAGRFRLSPVLAWNTEQASRPSLYPGGEVRIDFLEGSFVRIFGGRTPGGLVCSGGVCRDVPPFEGALAEVVLRL